MSYNIIRHYFNHPGRREVIASGLTLEEAQEHCNAVHSRGTGPSGPWFDGYTADEGREGEVSP